MELTTSSSVSRATLKMSPCSVCSKKKNMCWREGEDRRQVRGVIYYLTWPHTLTLTPTLYMYTYIHDRLTPTPHYVLHTFVLCVALHTNSILLSASSKSFCR